MSESDNVQRVRVVDAWAVKTSKGKYLDAHAVNVVNTIIILLLVSAAFSWLAQAWILFKVITFTYGVNPYFWYWSEVGGDLVSAIVRFFVAFINLIGVKLIVEHNPNTATLITLFSVLFFAIGLLIEGVTSDLQFVTTTVYLAIGFLASLVRRYYQ